MQLNLSLNLGNINQPLCSMPPIDSPRFQKKSDPHITFLFEEIILNLIQQIQDALFCTPLSEHTIISEQIIQQSLFYSLLANLQQLPLNIKILLLTILHLNEYCVHTPKDKEIITQVILTCFRLLSKTGDWKPTDATDDFFEKFYHLHTLNYGNKDNKTPAFELMEAGLATKYLSPESQAFMDDVMYDTQFLPIAECLMQAGCNIAKPKTQKKIALIAHNFFIKVEQSNYQLMKNDIYAFPGLNQTSVFIGMDEFRQITIRTKYLYMKALRQLHISCIKKAKLNKNSLKLFEKTATISKQSYTISFAAVCEQQQMTIKAITVSLDHPLDSTQDTNSNLENLDQDVYFFVQEFEKETPQLPPDPAIPLSERPLYKFELIPNSHYIRLQKASSELRENILNLIEEIEREVTEETKNKIIVDCIVYTAIWHQKELMLVEIIRQVGSSLSSRTLDGAIKSYVKHLATTKAFKSKLQKVLFTVYVSVMNKYLSTWHQDDLLKPLITESFPPIQESPEMEKLKELTWGLFNNHKRPGKWLFKSIITCCYDGNPATLASLNDPHVNESKKLTTLHFEECLKLLNAALKTQHGQVVLSLVKAMVKGLLAIMKRSKEKNMIADLIQYFQSVEKFPIEIISNIMKAEETLQQKACRLLLFSLQSLKLEATKEQYNSIIAFLNNAAVETPKHIEKHMEYIAHKTINELKLPYEDKSNSFIVNAQEQLLDWIKTHQIIKDQKSRKRIEMAAFATLIGKAHPEANLEQVSTVTDFATWLFIYDDIIEKQKKLKTIQNLHARTLSILDGSTLNEMDNPLTQGFFDIIQRINKIRDTSVWKVRFREDVLEYCKATLWEWTNRKKGKIPSLEEYKKHRPGTSGTKVMFDFIEPLKDITIPQEIFQSNYFQMLRLLGSNLVNWANDILSAPKEFVNQDIHNLVFVHQDENATNYEEAFQQAGKDLSRDLDAFMKLSQQIPSDYEPHKEVIQKYIQGIMDWVAAHHFWAIASPRYNSSLTAPKNVFPYTNDQE